MASTVRRGAHQPFDGTTARVALVNAAARAGLDPAGATLLRLGENALFHLPAMAAVGRVARSMDHWGAASKEVAVSRWLAQNEVPAARVVEVAQPVEGDGYPVTFWHFIDGRQGTRADVRVLGALLKRVHQLPRPPRGMLPSEHILDRVRPRVERSSIEAADKHFLLARCDELASKIEDLEFELPPSPIHGDAHIKNLMIVDDTTYLIDFERFSWGQPEWDLSMTATEYVTAGFWTEGEYKQFVEAYGMDVTKWSGFETLRAVHEIKMTTWIMQNVHTSMDIASEFAKRMVTLRTGEAARDWTPF